MLRSPETPRLTAVLDQVVDALRAYEPEQIILYGSLARGDAGAFSDIDLIVELREPKFDDLAGLYIYMEQTLGRKVDIRRLSKNINTPFMRRIEKEALFV